MILPDNILLERISLKTAHLKLADLIGEPYSTEDLMDLTGYILILSHRNKQRTKEYYEKRKPKQKRIHNEKVWNTVSDSD